MPSEKATALVLRTTDWSESSRIATLWTREFGKVRVLAKGGRRLKSAFENALDLLTVCRIVFLRKSSDSLDLLTEAQVIQRFPRLRTDLAALYAAYYIAELLDQGTRDYDPHPLLFDETLDALQTLGGTDKPGVAAPGLRVARFEIVLLRELGYSPVLDHCAGCGGSIVGTELAFSAAGHGVLCRRCRSSQRDSRLLSPSTWQMLRELTAPGDAWRRCCSAQTRAEVRQLLGQYVTYLLGRRPRLLSYLGS